MVPRLPCPGHHIAGCGFTQLLCNYKEGIFTMRTGLALLFMGAMAVTLSATVHPAVDIPALAKGAEKVVVASVQQVDARFDTNEFGDKLIVSDAALRVEETLKGAQSASATVTDEGGTVRKRTLDAAHTPAPQDGDDP